MSANGYCNRDGARLSRPLIQIVKPTHYRNRHLFVEVERGEGAMIF
jgi:hypothetical protein